MIGWTSDRCPSTCPQVYTSPWTQRGLCVSGCRTSDIVSLSFLVWPVSPGATVLVSMQDSSFHGQDDTTGPSLAGGVEEAGGPQDGMCGLSSSGCLVVP